MLQLNRLGIWRCAGNWYDFSQLWVVDDFGNLHPCGVGNHATIRHYIDQQS